MSSYSLNEIKKYAQSSIKDIIPLDDESIDEIIQYTLKNFKSRDGISNHLLDILGPSDITFEFLKRFNDMLFGDTNEGSDKTPKSISKPVQTQVPAKKTINTNSSGKSRPGTIKLVKVKKVPSSVTGSTVSTSVGPNRGGRMSANTSKGATTSEMFDMKPKTVESQKSKKKEFLRKLDNIKELDDVLMEVELMNSRNRTDGDIRICNCNATKHPLFEMYPNCLNCGKIICEKEGMQPCSFCGEPLMSETERNELIEIFNREKAELEKETESKPIEVKPKPKKKNVIKISLNQTGQSNFKVQEKFFKQIEEKQKKDQEEIKVKKEEEEMIEQNKNELEYYRRIHKKDEELIKAEERLSMLLSFQENGAERTKIIDQASDFEMPTGTGSLWASPMERALQLKRQQKNFRRMEDARLQRSGRGETKVDVVIKNGKVEYHNKTASDNAFLESLSDDEEIQGLQKQVNKEKQLKMMDQFQDVYDYDDVNKQLFKPVYLGKGGTSADDTALATQSMKDLPELGTVVQLGDSESQENQLFNMVGV